MTNECFKVIFTMKVFFVVFLKGYKIDIFLYRSNNFRKPE